VKVFVAGEKRRQTFHFERLSLLKGHLLRGDEVKTLSPEQAEACPRSRFSTSKNVRC